VVFPSPQTQPGDGGKQSPLPAEFYEVRAGRRGFTRAG
jgi:hypothetical protein